MDSNFYKTLNGTVKLEVHFSQQNEVALFAETNITDDMREKLSEVVSFCCLIVRQISNLNNAQMTKSITSELACASTDLPSFIKEAYATNPTLRIVDYRGPPGRKRFFTKLQLTNGSPHYALKAKGFGLLAAGMGFYAATGITSTLAFLAARRGDDQKFMDTLVEVSQLFSLSMVHSQIGMTNHLSVAGQIATSAFESAYSGGELQSQAFKKMLSNY